MNIDINSFLSFVALLADQKKKLLNALLVAALSVCMYLWVYKMINSLGLGLFDGVLPEFRLISHISVVVIIFLFIHLYIQEKVLALLESAKGRAKLSRNNNILKIDDFDIQGFASEKNGEICLHGSGDGMLTRKTFSKPLLLNFDAQIHFGSSNTWKSQFHQLSGFGIILGAYDFANYFMIKINVRHNDDVIEATPHHRIDRRWYSAALSNESKQQLSKSGEWYKFEVITQDSEVLLKMYASTDASKVKDLFDGTCSFKLPTHYPSYKQDDGKSNTQTTTSIVDKVRWPAYPKFGFRADWQEQVRIKNIKVSKSMGS